MSKLSLITKEQLQSFYDTSSSKKEILEACGMTANSGNNDTLTRYTIKNNIDKTKFIENQLRNNNVVEIFKRRRDYKSEFKENSDVSRNNLKKYIIKNDILPYICQECGNPGIHNNKPLVLQLEHINGVRNDNRVDNLCFLCPNCHTQTSTYAGKRLKKEKKSNRKSPEQVQASYDAQRKFLITEQELKDLFDKGETYVSIGKLYNVSDNTIRKYAKRYNLK